MKLVNLFISDFRMKDVSNATAIQRVLQILHVILSMDNVLVVTKLKAEDAIVVKKIHIPRMQEVQSVFLKNNGFLNFYAIIAISQKIL